MLQEVNRGYQGIKMGPNREAGGQNGRGGPFLSLMKEQTSIGILK